MYGKANIFIYLTPILFLNNKVEISFENKKIKIEDINPIKIDNNNDLINNSLLLSIFFSWNNLVKFGNKIIEILLIKKLGRNKIGLT